MSRSGRKRDRTARTDTGGSAEVSGDRDTREKRGPAAFENHYGDLFGERWGELRDALLASSGTVAFRDCLTQPYHLDPASVLAALALGVSPGDSVLDLCAAPGGKTLVLACGVSTTGTLVSNERSSARRARLHRVLESHLDPNLRAHVAVTGHDAARWAIHEPSRYDRVLADVPCSSEQHVLQSAGALAQWSPSRTRRLARGAYAIGCAAIDAVRPGGRVVYATCALSPLENDGVVARLLARGSQAVPPGSAARQDAEADGRTRKAAGPGAGIRVVTPGPVVDLLSRTHPELLPERLAGRAPGCATEHGWMILPDRDAGMGPMYVAILQRDEL